MVENPTHTSREEWESIAILLPTWWWINSLQTVKKPNKLVGLLYLSFPEPQFKQRCFLMSCWQLIYSRFAFCLKSPTSPAWRATRFSLGQQNSANAAFIFHLNPRWGGMAHAQRYKYSQPHGWEWVLLCSCITSSNSQLEASQLIKQPCGALKNKPKQNPKAFPSFATSSLKTPSKKCQPKSKTAVSGTPEIQ